MAVTKRTSRINVCYADPLLASIYSNVVRAFDSPLSALDSQVAAWEFACSHHWKLYRTLVRFTKHRQGSWRPYRAEIERLPANIRGG